MAVFKVLVNDAVKRHLLLIPEKERQQIRKSFEFLENGLWEGGLRIKRLHGVSRVVLEARLNRSDRIVFTMGNSHQPDEKLIFVWGIASHDDLSRTARSIRSDATSFLAFTRYDAEDTVDVDLEALGEAAFTEERIEQRAGSDSGPQRWFLLDDTEWQRLLLYSKDEFETFLYLTAEQRALLNKKPPLLVSGTAGSGKTTLCVYYLLHPSLLRGRRALLTYNKNLRAFCERLYHGLINQRPDYDQIGPVDFLTYHELCRKIVPHSVSQFVPEREIDCFSFRRLFSKHKLYERYDAVLVWEEIMSVIKGAKPQISPHKLKIILQQWASLTDGPVIRELREELLALRHLSVREKTEAALQRLVGCSITETAAQLERLLAGKNSLLHRALQTIVSQIEKHEADFSAPLMTFREYESMGQKRAPAFVHNRNEIYSIAEWYQSRLQAEGLWDQIDLTRAAIRAIDQDASAPAFYDFVCCDEIQDFSDVQLSLLIRLPAKPEMLLLAGDPKQIINPSGFRWEEVKGLFFDRGLPVPDVHHLTLNFRCVGSIVALSNVLLKLKQELLGVRSDEKMDDWKYQGRPPFLIDSMEPKVLIEILQATGADRTILTREDQERDYLKQALGTELVFTIEEAKGLEFRSVILWKFCNEGTIEDLWSRILRADIARHHDALVRHEINLLYVGITRAQQNLILYDGPVPSMIWTDRSVLNASNSFVNSRASSSAIPDSFPENTTLAIDRNGGYCIRRRKRISFS